MNVETKHLSDELNRVLETFKKFLPYLQSIQHFQMVLLKALTTR